MRSFINFYHQLFHNAKTKKAILTTILLPCALLFCAIFFTLNGITVAALGSRPKTLSYSSELQTGIAEQVLRLHVIANSDSEEDQSIKLQVKDALIEYMKTFLTDAESKQESIDLLTAHLPELKVKADEVLKALGANYDAQAYLGKADFPIKVYGDVTLPAGTYDALCIRLGKAEGKNWWCIVFPNLCFVDSTYSVVPTESKDQLRYLLTEEEFESITSEPSDVNSTAQDPPIVVRFKLWEWIKNLFS